MGLEVAGAVDSGFLNIAHRGARSIAPENTIAAARRAIDAGARMWELDVRLSRDGCPVVLHDETLNRTSNARAVFPLRKPWKVQDFMLEELRSIDFGSWFAEADPFRQVAEGLVSPGELESYKGEAAPTLEEALVFTIQNDWLVNIEIKDLSGLPGHDEIAEKVVRVVASLDAHGRVIVSSFNHDYLRRVKRADRRISTGPLVTRPPLDPAALMRELGAYTYHAPMRAFVPAHVKRLNELGFRVLVWTVNSARTARILFKHGVAGVFTDFPRKMHEVIKTWTRQ